MTPTRPDEARLYELFVRSNPVASFWLGRQAEPPRSQARVEDQPSSPETAEAEGEKISVN